MNDPVRDLELKYDGAIPAEELAEAKAGGKLPLALMRARGQMRFWNARVWADIRNLRVVREWDNDISLARANRNLAYYRRHRREALGHLIRLQAQERAEAKAARPKVSLASSSVDRALESMFRVAHGVGANDDEGSRDD